MDISYFALKPINVDGEIREPGELIPEARDWAALTGYIQECKIAPVLVATLPASARQALAEWEAEVDGVNTLPFDSVLDIVDDGATDANDASGDTVTEDAGSEAEVAGENVAGENTNTESETNDGTEPGGHPGGPRKRAPRGSVG